VKGDPLERYLIPGEPIERLVDHPHPASANAVQQLIPLANGDVR